MEEVIQAACNTKQIPGVLLLASSRDGRFACRRVFGVSSMASGEPLRDDNVMWLASCTKLLTAICVLQCVERGLVTLDQDLRPMVPELQDLDIVESGTNGEMICTRNDSPVTMRQLLTHTSGFCYERSSPVLTQWRSQQSTRPTENSVRGRYRHPLIFRPGTSWSYGPSIDWAGVVVEMLTGLSLEEYMEQNIWLPLGIKNMTYFLSKRTDLQERCVTMSWRAQAEDVVEAAKPNQRNPCFEQDPEDAAGGGGLFSEPGEFFKVVKAVLFAAHDSASDAQTPPPRQLLRRSSAQMLFEPQLDNAINERLLETFSTPPTNHMISNMPLGTSKTFSLGGLLLQENLPGWRNKGTLTWGGIPNLTWKFIDRKIGLCGLYASQVMPIGDPKSNDLLHVFEKAMYERYSQLLA